jgi:predicted nucleotide-binding protein
MGFRVTYWKTGFESGQVILDQLLEASFSCKYAILLLTPDEELARDASRRVPSANVSFELGFFINALGKERTRAIVQEGTEVLADYGGHIFISLPKAIRSIGPSKRKR